MIVAASFAASLGGLKEIWLGLDWDHMKTREHDDVLELRIREVVDADVEREAVDAGGLGHLEVLVPVVRAAAVGDDADLGEGRECERGFMGKMCGRTRSTRILSSKGAR